MCCLIAVLVLLLGAGGARAYRYVPDRAFGSGGSLDLLAVNAGGGSFYRVSGVRPGPAGSFWVHYRALAQPGQYECEAQSYIAHYLANGAPDRSFGIGGFAPLYSPVGCSYPSLQTDSRLRPLVTWDSDGGVRGPSTLAIARYTLGGALDPSFDHDGVLLLSIPCPGGNGAGVSSDAAGDLILGLSCWADESAEGLPNSPLQSFFVRLFADGSLDTGFGDGGLVTFPLEEGWGLPGVVAVEAGGSAILRQETRLGAPQQAPRLLRLSPRGTLDSRYRMRTEASMRRIAALAAPRVPGEMNDFVLREDGDLVVAGRADRGGWVATLRRDGSLQPRFSGDGFRRFSKDIRYVAEDLQGRLFVLGNEYTRWWIQRLLPDGNRDRTVGGSFGQRLSPPSRGSLADLVSFWHGLPVLYLTNLGSCSSPRDCAEPAELRRLRLAAGRPRR